MSYYYAGSRRTTTTRSAPSIETTDAHLGTVRDVTDTAAAPTQVPLVSYLVLGERPHLVAHQCTSCGARFFDRRNACAGCFGTSFEPADIATEGEVRAFTIVTFAAPGVPVPFVAGVVDCDGTSVRANVINVEPDAEHVRTGMKVRLATTAVGVDSEGVEAVGFGFEPVEGQP